MFTHFPLPMTRRSYRSLARRSAVNADITPGGLEEGEQKRKERARTLEFKGNQSVGACRRYRQMNRERERMKSVFFSLEFFR
jgi:hypothetical protein